jgi:hypothetical protein
MRSQGMSVGGAEMMKRGSRRYGLETDQIFTTVRRIGRQYKGMSCRGSPVPLCKSAGTKQLKVVHGAYATCVLQNVDSLLVSTYYNTFVPGGLVPTKVQQSK